ncbi:hypothetical protein EDD29_3632 [Actinocorallia herbida]|uniref:Uncharacterized protein n=1 Tax=Actinocorallia herbida TaxID=58109 RepID=A0A3N1CXS3_9ACTN|nr:hypothetical protein [Actinocorallia herbida]ROO86071.1 hypothetical protein EDD29_3632 [Actinocorallia herbida]
MSAGVAIVLLSAWGWRRGEPWVWWSLALSRPYLCAGRPPSVVNGKPGPTAGRRPWAST